MIAAAGTAVGGAFVAPQPALASANAMSEAPVAADPAAAPATTGGTATRAPAARPQATGLPPEPCAPSACAPDDFAVLLAGTGDDAPAAALPATPTVGAAEEAGTTSGTSDAAALPDRMLALLDASWAQPAQSAGPAAASPQTAPSVSAAPAAVMQAVPGLANERTQSAGIATTVAPAHGTMPADLAGPAIAIDFAAMTGAPVDANTPLPDPVTPTEANGPAPAFPPTPAVVPAMASAPAARAAMVAPLPVPAEPQAGFEDGFAARLVWMAEQRLGHAEIRLNPEHLGPIEVRVQVEGTEVRAEFQSQHASVRQAIEASVPRLREMLGQQGLQLGQTDVGQRHAGSGAPAREGSDHAAGDTAPAASSFGRPTRSRGLVDEYA